MIDPAILSDKTALREAASLARAKMSPATDAPERLRDRFMAGLDDFGLKPSGVIAAFWPIGTEVDLRPLMDALDGLGFRVALPVVGGADAPLGFRRWQPETALEDGPFGTRQPGEAAEALVPALILVPLLAFDRQGYRIGYGGGFYDRTLDVLRRAGGAGGPVIAIGAAFSGQEVPAVPHDDHDQRLDWVVTEDDMIRIESA